MAKLTDETGTLGKAGETSGRETGRSETSGRGEKRERGASFFWQHECSAGFKLYNIVGFLSIIFLYQILPFPVQEADSILAQHYDLAQTSKAGHTDNRS